MSIGLVIVAAGNSTRMGKTVRKPYLSLGGLPILLRTLQPFMNVPQITEIVLVVHRDEIARTENLLHEHKIHHIRVIAGGKERQDSVYAGLCALSQTIDYVLIHDGARPFIQQPLIQRVIDEVMEKNAVIPAVPVKDTIKVVQSSGKIVNTPDRNGLWAAQTPQAFSLALLHKAYKEAQQRGITGTDDASLLEALGYEVYITKGEGTNIKITTPEDMLYGEAILRAWEEKK